MWHFFPKFDHLLWEKYASHVDNLYVKMILTWSCIFRTCLNRADLLKTKWNSVFSVIYLIAFFVRLRPFWISDDEKMSAAARTFRGGSTLELSGFLAGKQFCRPRPPFGPSYPRTTKWSQFDLFWTSPLDFLRHNGIRPLSRILQFPLILIFLIRFPIRPRKINVLFQVLSRVQLWKSFHLKAKNKDWLFKPTTNWKVGKKLK